jgi:hypothetical protein
VHAAAAGGGERERILRVVGSIICMRTVGFLYGVGVTLKESIWHGGRRLVGVGVSRAASSSRASEPFAPVV